MIVRPGNPGECIGYFPTANTDAARGVQFALAVSDNQPGDILSVYQSCLTTINFAKDGLVLFLAPGVTITQTDSAAGFMFDDNAGAMSYKILGYGKLVRNVSILGAIAGNPGFGVVKVSNASSNVVVQYDEIQTNITAGDASHTVIGASIICTAGTLYTNGRLSTINNADPTLSGLTAFWWDNGEMNCSGQSVVDLSSNAGNNYLIWSTAGNEPTGDFRFNFQRIDGGQSNMIAGGIAIYSTMTNANAAMWGTSLTVLGQITSGGGKVYVNGQKHIGAAGAAGSTSKFYYNFLKTGGVVNDEPYITINGGYAELTVGQFDPDASAAELVKVGGGTVLLSGGDFTAAAANNAIWCSAGTLNILSGKITSDAGKLDIRKSGTGAITVTPAVSYDPTKISTSGITLVGLGPGTTLSAYASGTVYSLTATPAAIAFGTTSPSISLNKIGRWEIEAVINVQYNAATFAASRTVATKLRDTTNSVDLTNGSDTAATDIVTTKTISLTRTTMKTEYTITAQPAVVTVFGSVSVVPTAGSLDCVAPGTFIRARYLGPN